MRTCMNCDQLGSTTVRICLGIVCTDDVPASKIFSFEACLPTTVLCMFVVSIMPKHYLDVGTKRLGFVLPQARIIIDKNDRAEYRDMTHTQRAGGHAS